MTNSTEKQVTYVSCRFLHHNVIFCQLFSIHNHCKRAPMAMGNSEYADVARVKGG